jgi:hypothetical protein
VVVAVVVVVLVQLSTVAVAARLYLAACRIGSPLHIRLNDTECADNMIILGVLNEVATTSLERITLQQGLSTSNLFIEINFTGIPPLPIGSLCRLRLHATLARTRRRDDDLIIII